MILLLGAVGCAVQRGPTLVGEDGKEYGPAAGLWRDRWWDYYRQGSSYAKGKFWDHAIASFQEAIKRRDADARDARQYGFHFTGYFPHRELGVVYYHLSRYAEAIQELEASMRSDSTARAKFYLNRARQAQLEQFGRDTVPPRIVVERPRQGLLTNRFNLEVSGYVEDDFYVAAVVINGTPLFIELAEPRLAFAQEIALQEGANAIDIVAVDLVGRQASTRVVVQVDHQGPLLGVDRVGLTDRGPPHRVRVEGALSDASAVVRFALAGRPIMPRPQQQWEFREEITVADDAGTIAFEAEDAAGNVSRGEIALVRSEGEAPAIRKGEAPLSPLERWALLPSSTSLSVADFVTVPAVPMQTVQTSGPSPPEIALRGILADPLQRSFYDAKVFIEALVRGSSAITAFSINGKPLHGLDGKRKVAYPHYTAGLQPGLNRFVLEAIDAAGRSSREEIVVTRQVEEAKRIDSRLYVALLPIVHGGHTLGLDARVSALVEGAFYKLQRFYFLERRRIDDILLEHQISRSSLADEEVAIKAGKLLAAEGIMAGTVFEPFGGIEVHLSVVDVDLGVTLAKEDVYGDDMTRSAVESLMDGLAWKIKQHIPLVEGLILQKDGMTIYTSLAEGHRVRKHMKLIIFRDGEEIKDARHGRTLRKPGKRMGEARIEVVTADLSEARLLRVEDSEIDDSDKVITK